MIIYITEEGDIHKPIACLETHYTAVPRIGEKVIVFGQLYKVLEVYHNLDVQEIKLVMKKVE